MSDKQIMDAGQISLWQAVFNVGKPYYYISLICSDKLSPPMLVWQNIRIQHTVSYNIGTHILYSIVVNYHTPLNIYSAITFASKVIIVPTISGGVKFVYTGGSFYKIFRCLSWILCEGGSLHKNFDIRKISSHRNIYGEGLFQSIAWQYRYRFFRMISRYFPPIDIVSILDVEGDINMLLDNLFLRNNNKEHLKLLVGK